MIIGDFTKKPPPRDLCYSVEFDPKQLNRAQKRAFAAYIRHELALEIRHLRAQSRKRAAKQQKLTESVVIPDNEQTGEASITIS